MSWTKPQVLKSSVVVAATAIISSLGLLAVSSAQVGAAANPFPHTTRGGFATPTGNGFCLAFADGSVDNFGDARFFGDAHSLPLQGSIQGGSSVSTGGGYWLVGGGGAGFLT